VFKAITNCINYSYTVASYNDHVKANFFIIHRDRVNASLLASCRRKKVESYKAVYCRKPIEQHQLNHYILFTTPESTVKYYNELYSISIANNFNGNILYYALKAVETDNNRTKVGIEELEDNEIITSISDHNRFTPAGMQTTNKAVCAKILQEMDTEAS